MLLIGKLSNRRHTRTRTQQFVVDPVGDSCHNLLDQRISRIARNIKGWRLHDLFLVSSLFLCVYWEIDQNSVAIIVFSVLVLYRFLRLG